MTARLPLGPVPLFELPPWSNETAAAWARQTSRAATLGKQAGAGRNFGLLVAEARRLLAQGDNDAIVARLKERRFARALLTAWLDDEPLARATMSKDLLVGLTASQPISRLTTIIAATLFLRHFDQLDGWHSGLFAATRDVVRSAVGAPAPGRRPDAVEALRRLDAFAFELDGPLRLAQHLLTAAIDFTDWLRVNHLTAYADSRFGRVVRDAYYLALIEAADAELGDHAFLEAVTSDVLAQQRTDRTDEDRLYFGHQVLTALTAKTTRHPSKVWLEGLLVLGGDPRFSETDQWRRWWSRVPEENVRRAIRWMRSLDLRAFLDGVGEYAAATSNESMIRMLERRRRLLLGLYEQDRVEDVRLILGSGIRRYVERSTTFVLQEVANLRDSGKQDTAIVYLDCGDFCIIEGSHNFSIHVFLGGPLTKLADRRVRTFDGGELRERIPLRHKESHGDDSHMSVPHQGFEWVRKVLDFLQERGIAVNERALMTPPDYADLSRRRANEAYVRWG